MYEVTTATKSMLTTTDKETAIWWAKILFNTYRYVEVKEIISTSPYYAKSVRIFSK